ncbi:ATP-grasp domain protein, partial [Bordetella hinzii L60]
MPRALARGRRGGVRRSRPGRQQPGALSALVRGTRAPPRRG